MSLANESHIGRFVVFKDRGPHGTTVRKTELLQRVYRGVVDTFCSFNGRRVITGLLGEIIHVHPATPTAKPHVQAHFCVACNDGEDRSVYPIYGVSPHECFYLIPGAEIGQSRELPEAEWPENFVLDPESGPHTGYPRTGVYTHCVSCGAGKH